MNGTDVLLKLRIVLYWGKYSITFEFKNLFNVFLLQKSTKSALETARTFSTLFIDMDYRHKLLEVQTESEFKQLLQQRTKLLSSHQGLPENRKSHLVLSDFEKDEAEVS